MSTVGMVVVVVLVVWFVSMEMYAITIIMTTTTTTTTTPSNPTVFGLLIAHRVDTVHVHVTALESPMPMSHKNVDEATTSTLSPKANRDNAQSLRAALHKESRPF